MPLSVLRNDALSLEQIRECGLEVDAVLSQLEQLWPNESPSKQEIKSGFIYLLKLCQESLLLAPDDDLIDLSNTLTELAGEFLDAKDFNQKSIDHFSTRLKSLFDEGLPLHIQYVHEENLKLLDEEPHKSHQVENVIPFPQKKRPLSSPKNLVKVLAACAVLSVPSDEIHFPEGPGFLSSEFDDLVPPTSDLVADVIVPNIDTGFHQAANPTQLTSPRAEIPFELWETVPYPLEVVQRESQSMAERLEFVLNHPDRRALYDSLRFHPGLDETVPLIGIIESNLNHYAISHSGAMGAFQGMGGTEGGFGDTYTLNRLLENADTLLPQIDYDPYNRAKERGGHHLKEFLIAQEDQNTAFWQEFLIAQQAILTNPETAQFVSHFYLRSLQLQAANMVGNHDMNASEVRYLAIGMYNVGPGNMRILKSIMQNYGIHEFSTNTMLRFIENPDFESHMAAQGRTHMLQSYYEVSSYVSRYIALEGLIRHNQPRLSGSTVG